MHTFGIMSKDAGPNSVPNESSLTRLSSRAAVALDVVTTVLRHLPEDEKRDVLRLAAAALPPDPAPRAGSVLGTVVSIFERERSRRTDWTVGDLKRAIAAEGVEAAPKTIHNALGYLARRGRIEQIGYGQYLLKDQGAVIVTSDNLGVGPGRAGDD